MTPEIESRITAVLDYLGAIGKGAVETELPVLAREVVTFGIANSSMTLAVCVVGAVVVVLAGRALYRKCMSKFQPGGDNMEAGMFLLFGGFVACGLMTACVVVGTQAATDLAKATLTPRVYLWEWVSRQVK